MPDTRLSGLIAAVYSPLADDGSICLDGIPAMLERLLADGISGLYVCGSTGEGMSLTREERMDVTKAWVEAAHGRVPVIVQVGHNSLAEARLLAAAAQDVGADIISATCPSYYKVTRVDGLIDCMAEVASAASGLPFYYYHIPQLTGSQISMREFLLAGEARIPNLAGLKYTDTLLHEFQDCLNLLDGRFDVVWGCDEMLLGALATGASAAIGSTYNIAAPLYSRLISEFMSGDLEAARRCQQHSVTMIRTLCRYPFHSAMKCVLRRLGDDFGQCRLPQQMLSDDDAGRLMLELTSIGFFEWGRQAEQDGR
jgi:N-acetylneuraminate lyase